MPFFQNVIDADFSQSWVLGDRQYSVEFKIPGNRNKSDFLQAYNFGPYDFSSANTLTFNYAWDVDFKSYSTLAINVAGATPAVTTASEVVSKLNLNSTFSGFWLAKLYTNKNQQTSVIIVPQQNRVKQNIRVWISNSSAETKLLFNKNAGVAELPTYFSRYTIDNRFTYDVGSNYLIELDTGDTIDQNIITNAGFDYTVEREDWELLEGRSGIFNFQKITVDASDRITEIIFYPAGAVAGDFAKKITYAYTADNLNPDQITEVPYTLTDSDLVTP